MDVFLEGMRFDSVNEQQQHHWDQMNKQQQQQFMQGSPRHNIPTSEHPTSRTSEKPYTKWTHSRSSTTDSYCQMHKIISRPSDCWVDWAWLDQIWRRKNFAIKVESIGPYYEQKKLDNMICIWYENAQAVNLNKYYLISLSQQLGYLVLRAW